MSGACTVSINHLLASLPGSSFLFSLHRGEARRGKARRDEAKQGETRQSKARQGKARRGEARQPLSVKRELKAPLQSLVLLLAAWVEVDTSGNLQPLEGETRKEGE